MKLVCLYFSFKFEIVYWNFLFGFMRASPDWQLPVIIFSFSLFLHVTLLLNIERSMWCDNQISWTKLPSNTQVIRKRDPYMYVREYSCALKIWT